MRRPPAPMQVALGLGAAIIVAFGSTAAGSAPTDPPQSSVDAETTVPASGGFVLPAGYTTLIDDTVHLSVAVPDTWTDITTQPDSADGATVPQINAATDIEVWRDTFDAPGVLYAAHPFTDDEEALYRERFEPTPSACADLEVVPYDDGAFAGQWWKHTGCGAVGEAEHHVIVASPQSEVATVAVVVKLAGTEERPVLDIVLQSFNFTPTATWPVVPAATTTSTSSTTTSTAPAATTTAPLDTVQVVNNSGLLTVYVPSSWTDIETVGTINNDGSYRPTIVAGPDLYEFAGGFAGPGMRVSALPPLVDPATVLANAWKPDDCGSSGETSFDNRQFTGLSESWSGCAGGTMDVMIIAARPPDGSFNLYAKVQAEAGTGLTSLIADSIAVADATTYPTTTGVETPVTAQDGAAPESLWQGPAQTQTVLVIDSLRRLRVDVPSSWRDVRQYPSYNDDGTDRPRIVASLHIDTMLQQFEVPGVFLIEYPYVDPGSFLTNLFKGSTTCPTGSTQTFDNGTYSGLMQTWSDCGDNRAARVVMLAVSPPDKSVTLYVEVQLPTDDNTALKTVLSSFGQL
jgi:hypothetical protein